MPSTTENVADGFPLPPILPIVGAPNYKTIAEVHLYLNSKATLIWSNLSDRDLGPLYPTIFPTVYNILLAITFIPSLNPGPTLDITIVSTAA